jgi:hypothetical protein
VFHVERGFGAHPQHIDVGLGGQPAGPVGEPAHLGPRRLAPIGVPWNAQMGTEGKVVTQLVPVQKNREDGFRGVHGGGNTRT